MRCRGAIFDLDGTLLNSMPLWETLGDHYLRLHGITSHEGLDDLLRPMSLSDAAAYLIKEYALCQDEKTVENDITRMIEREYRESLLLKPGAADFLRMFAASGVRMCIATATPEPLVRAALKRCGVMDCFRAVVTCAAVGCGKDSPEIYNTALTMLGTPRAVTLVVEDAPHAIHTARSSGFPVMAVYDAAAGDPAAIAAQSDWYCRDFFEAKEIFR